jgi:hypothetical protein
MAILEKLKLIGLELKNHSPFTLIGAVTGILLMLAGQKWFQGQAETLFSVFHPLHVLLSAMVTAALFEVHRKAKNFFIILIIGVVGSIGIATLSDCILPFFGETILGAAIPKHADLHAHGSEPEALQNVHEHTEGCVHDDEPVPETHEHSEDCGHPLLHIRPRTHLPHASHVLLSTWASSAHMLMNTHADMTAMLLLGMFIVLFLAVWLPCCVSDIIFPLLFAGSGAEHQPHACVFCRKKDTPDEK